MLNQAIVVGRLTDSPKLVEEGEKKVAYITLAVPRSFKNAEGIYDTDFIDFKLWDGVAKSTTEYCKKGDIVGVKGRIQSEKNEDENKMILVAEKVTFLSSRKPEEE